MTIISPESFSFWESVLMFAIVILGGSGSIPGVLLGAFLIVGLPEALQRLCQCPDARFRRRHGLDDDFPDPGAAAAAAAHYKLAGRLEGEGRA